VFGIEIEWYMRCGGRLKVIASIEEPELIERILAAAAEPGRGGGADELAWGASATAGVAVSIRLIVNRLVLSRASGGQCCVRRDRSQSGGSVNELKPAAKPSCEADSARVRCAL
jgi:hypothetical protein